MYSDDLRERVVEYARSPHAPSIALTASIFQISVTTVRRWLAGFKPKGTRTKKIDRVRACVLSISEEDPIVCARASAREGAPRSRPLDWLPRHPPQVAQSHALQFCIVVALP